MDNERTCDGVVECTALVLAESCAELDGRLTLFGILDELRPNGTDGGYSFVIYAKFEGCEHADGGERRARILITDEEGEILEESAEYSVWLSGEESPATIMAAFDLPGDMETEDTLLWVEAELDEETLAQTAIPLRERYNV
ncbi:MAG: hypothetical protein AVDCRST_MAG37-1265 [uncultured Rubrobacteraceae bacterium]|uniref:Uncharacterized protein n=1 Tax=uncultured Rubrobacteraceae bacterium TaxID=349277 RepID=A0A6J4QFR5_9ACTN|nr:MAG: hypothetical protein AVDCRST_MAG37-1265 [uncultured Rubrobacteraceae bacterium]